MEEHSSLKNKIIDATNIVSMVFMFLTIGVFVWFVFVQTFWEKLCPDISTCYAIVIFLAGIIITLQIRLLDEKKDWPALFLFILDILINILFIPAGLSLDSSGNHDGAIKVLNGAIWADFIVLVRCLVLIVWMYIKRYWGPTKKNKKSKCGDLFEYWLGKEEESNVVKRALTDKSFKQEDHNLETKDTNYELATYGDSILKVCFSQILFSEGKEKPSVERAKFESDEYLVRTVAKHYHLVDYIHIDSHNQDMPKNYEYVKPKKKNKKSPHKYIATAVEAMVGAIYIETKDLKAITELAKTWMELKDVK